MSAPGQATTSRAELGARLRHVDRLESQVEVGELVVGEAAEHEVLAVGDAHLDVEVAADRGDAAELRGGHVAESRPGESGHGAVGRAAHDVGLGPAELWRRAPQEHGLALADRRDDAAAAGGGVAALDRPGRGCRPARSTTPAGTSARRRCGAASRRSRARRRPTSCGPGACCRGCRSARRPGRRPRWSASRSSLEVNSSRASAGCGLAPRPPATNTRKPASTVPSSRVRFTATTPTSLNMAWPQSVAQPEKLILNLRGRRCEIGLRRKCRNVASAHGLDVEHLVGAGAGEVAAHDVADGVGAGLTRGQPDSCQVPQQVGHPLEVDEVELHVLAGGEVAPTTAVASRRSSARASSCVGVIAP